MNTQRALAIAASAVATMGAGLALAGTAAAHPLAGPAVLSRAGTMTATSSGYPTPKDTSYNAGYLATATGALTLDFQVPSVRCEANDTQPVLQNLILFGDDTNDNFDSSGVSMAESCQSGDTVAFDTDNSIGAGTTVAPGDVIQVSVSVTPTSESVSWTDLNSGATDSTDAGTGFTVTTAQTTVQGAFANSNGGVFPKFSKAYFTDVQVDGGPLSLAGPSREYQVSSTGKKEIISSLIQAQDNFNDTWISG